MNELHSNPAYQEMARLVNFDPSDTAIAEPNNSGISRLSPCRFLKAETVAEVHWIAVGGHIFFLCFGFRMAPQEKRQEE